MTQPPAAPAASPASPAPAAAPARVDQVECVVIGAGVVGLAVARALALAGHEVLVLEAAHAIGTGISSRNSEVIHAGLYDAPGSLKARLCVQGKQALYAYCAERGIGHRRCGKLLVATQHEQVAQLHLIIEKARQNGVHDLVLLDRAQAQALEPALRCEGAVFSPSTGIVDSHALMLSLQGDLENAGGLVVLNSALARAEQAAGALNLFTQDGSCVQARWVVNAAGLHAPAVAATLQGLEARHIPKAYFAKGNYFTLKGPAPFSHLIYPLPQAGGLGVHLTLDLGGQAKFGPDVQWVDSGDDVAVDPARAGAFYREVRRYWPALADGDLVPGYAGIRPKIHAPNTPACDFLIQGPATHGVAGWVNLFGIESPGLTSALALGAHLVAHFERL